MRLLYGADYTYEEKISFRLCIHQTIIETMETLCRAVMERHPGDGIISSAQFQVETVAEIVAQTSSQNKSFNKYHFPGFRLFANPKTSTSIGASLN